MNSDSFVTQKNLNKLIERIKKILVKFSVVHVLRSLLMNHLFHFTNDDLENVNKVNPGKAKFPLKNITK